MAAFSNRAMCWIKLKEWRKAELDCTLALGVDPEHVKSLQRRATARNALGMHRAALSDLEAAVEAASEQGTGLKALNSDKRKTKELLKSAIRSAPKRRVPITAAMAPSFPVVAPPAPAPMPPPPPPVEEVKAAPVIQEVAEEPTPAPTPPPAPAPKPEVRARGGVVKMKMAEPVASSGEGGAGAGAEGGAEADADAEDTKPAMTPATMLKHYEHFDPTSVYAGNAESAADAEAGARAVGAEDSGSAKVGAGAGAEANQPASRGAGAGAGAGTKKAVKKKAAGTKKAGTAGAKAGGKDPTKLKKSDPKGAFGLEKVGKIPVPLDSPYIAQISPTHQPINQQPNDPTTQRPSDSTT